MLAGLDPYQRLYARRTGSLRSSAMRDLMAEDRTFEDLAAALLQAAQIAPR
jgi:hypothetical protein